MSPAAVREQYAAEWYVQRLQGGGLSRWVAGRYFTGTSARVYFPTWREAFDYAYSQATGAWDFTFTSKTTWGGES